ncbi:MAG: glycosyltransferase family 4 protein [Rhizobiaceae bacterium]
MKPKIAFYAPIKPPDHEIASGDREIARLMVRALEASGYDVEIASRFIAYQKRPSRELFEVRKQGAQDELERLKSEWRKHSETDRPSLWFTYHPYCKAPDWLGPAIAEEFKIPYVTAEACRTRQGTDADWAEARHQVQESVHHAVINFCLKQSDLAYLKSFMVDQRSIRPLAPFVDLAELDALTAEIEIPSFEANAPIVVAAGMMRPGTKTQSYLYLAAALSRIADEAWNLVIIGDGPARSEVEAAFSWAGDGRIHWTGAVSRAEVLAWFDKGDIFAWPGLREAIGMVFMEAQSRRLPVVAFDALGAPLVVQPDRTGLLTPELDIDAYADALKRLLNDAGLCAQMGEAARVNIAENHDISRAVRTFTNILGPMIGDR